MKIRNGFVSNSSSSSYILTFQDKVLGVKDIIEYLENNPNVPIILQYEDDTNEGENVFVLTNGERNYILENKEKFLEVRDGNEWVAYLNGTMYNAEEDKECELEETPHGYKAKVTWSDYRSHHSFNIFKLYWDGVFKFGG